MSTRLRAGGWPFLPEQLQMPITPTRLSAGQWTSVSEQPGATPEDIMDECVSFLEYVAQASKEEVEIYVRVRKQQLCRGLYPLSGYAFAKLLIAIDQCRCNNEFLPLIDIKSHIVAVSQSNIAHQDRIILDIHVFIDPSNIDDEGDVWHTCLHQLQRDRAWEQKALQTHTASLDQYKQMMEVSRRKFWRERIYYWLRQSTWGERHRIEQGEESPEMAEIVDEYLSRKYPDILE